MVIHTGQIPEKSLEVPSDPIWRLTVEQYHQMIEAGILTEDDPLELLEGWLVTKMPKNPPHTLATQITRDVLASILPSGWFINIQEPITMTDSEPEPDVTVIRGDRRDYLKRHPNPAKVALLVEVADATLQKDRRLKLRLYAEAGIAIYWILNLPERQLEVYSDPAGKGAQAAYRKRIDYNDSDRVPVVIEGHEVGQIAVQALLA